MLKLVCKSIIKKYAKEHLKEFRKAKIAKRYENYLVFVGDKHHFHFSYEKFKYKLIKITEIVYF